MFENVALHVSFKLFKVMLTDSWLILEVINQQLNCTLLVLLSMEINKFLVRPSIQMYLCVLRVSSCASAGMVPNLRTVGHMKLFWSENVRK